MAANREHRSLFQVTFELLQEYRAFLVGSSSWAFRFWLIGAIVNRLNSRGASEFSLRSVYFLEKLPILYRAINFSSTWALGRIWGQTESLTKQIDIYFLHKGQTQVEFELTRVKKLIQDFQSELPNRPSKVRLSALTNILSFAIIVGLSAIPVAGTIVAGIEVVPFPIAVVLIVVLGILGEVLLTIWSVSLVLDVLLYWWLKKKLDISKKENEVTKHFEKYILEMGRTVFYPPIQTEKNQ